MRLRPDRVAGMPAIRITKLLALLLLLGLTTACGDDTTEQSGTTSASPTEETSGTTTPHGPSATDTKPETTVDTSPPATSDDTGTTGTAESLPAGPLVLLTDGIGAFTLGADQDEVLDTMFGILGPASDVGPIECPGGSDTTAYWPSVGLVFSDGQLSGWSWGRDGEEPPPIEAETPEGITIGSTVAELEAAYPDELNWIPESTLGTEFYVGSGYPGFGGFTTGTEPDDTVTMLYGGDLCAFR